MAFSIFDETIIGNIFIIIIAIMFLRATWGQIICIIKGNPFGDKKMKSDGFTKRIVVYDFQSWFERISSFRHWWTVGIWLNYEKQLVALRLDKDSCNRIDVPFNEIQSVEAFEDEREITKAWGLGPFVTAKSDEICKGLQVRINTDTRTYYLKLWEPLFGATIKKTSNQYSKIQECAWSIVDEIKYIIKNY